MAQKPYYSQRNLFYLANMTAVQNLHAMTNLGPFHARVPRSRPLTTKGVCIPHFPKFVYFQLRFNTIPARPGN